MTVSRARDAAAEAARIEAVAARRRVGILARLAGRFGVRTPAVRDAEIAEDRAGEAESQRDQGDPLRAELRGVDRAARLIVLGRDAERAAWASRPEVMAARREAQGNHLVMQAVANPAIARVADANLPAAREIMLAREAEESRAAAEELRMQQAEEAACMHGYGQGGPRPPGRR